MNSTRGKADHTCNPVCIHALACHTRSLVLAVAALVLAILAVTRTSKAKQE